MVCLAPRAREDSVRPRRLSGVVVRPLNFTVRPHLMAAVAHKQLPVVWRSLALIWLVVALIGAVYSGVRLAMPQLTSQNYRDLRSGRLRVPPIIIIPGDERGRTMSTDAYLESARQTAMANALSRERRDASLGLAIWGAMLVVGAAGCWFTVRSNNRWRGP